MNLGWGGQALVQKRGQVSMGGLTKFSPDEGTPVRDQEWIKCGSGEHRSQEMTRGIEEIVTLGYEGKEKREEKEREEEEKKRRKGKREKKKEEAEIGNLQRKRKMVIVMNLVMINLNQAKLMNEENWVEIETTE